MFSDCDEPTRLWLFSLVVMLRQDHQSHMRTHLNVKSKQASQQTSQSVQQNSFYSFKPTLNKSRRLKLTGCHRMLTTSCKWRRRCGIFTLNKISVHQKDPETMEATALLCFHPSFSVTSLVPLISRLC